MGIMKYLSFKLSSINGTKQLLFGIFLVLIAIWSWLIGSEGGGTIFGLIALICPIIGVIFAISGLVAKDK